MRVSTTKLLTSLPFIETQLLRLKQSEPLRASLKHHGAPMMPPVVKKVGDYYLVIDGACRCLIMMEMGATEIEVREAQDLPLLDSFLSQGKEAL